MLRAFTGWPELPKHKSEINMSMVYVSSCTSHKIVWTPLVRQHLLWANYENWQFFQRWFIDDIDPLLRKLRIQGTSAFVPYALRDGSIMYVNAHYGGLMWIYPKMRTTLSASRSDARYYEYAFQIGLYSDMANILTTTEVSFYRSLDDKSSKCSEQQYRMVFSHLVVKLLQGAFELESPSHIDGLLTQLAKTVAQQGYVVNLLSCPFDLQGLISVLVYITTAGGMGKVGGPECWTNKRYTIVQNLYNLDSCNDWFLTRYLLNDVYTFRYGHECTKLQNNVRNTFMKIEKSLLLNTQIERDQNFPIGFGGPDYGRKLCVVAYMLNVFYSFSELSHTCGTGIALERNDKNDPTGYSSFHLCYRFPITLRSNCVRIRVCAANTDEERTEDTLATLYNDETSDDDWIDAELRNAVPAGVTIKPLLFSQLSKIFNN